MGATQYYLFNFKVPLVGKSFPTPSLKFIGVPLTHVTVYCGTVYHNTVWHLTTVLCLQVYFYKFLVFHQNLNCIYLIHYVSLHAPLMINVSFLTRPYLGCTFFHKYLVYNVYATCHPEYVWSTRVLHYKKIIFKPIRGRVETDF